MVTHVTIGQVHPCLTFVNVRVLLHAIWNKKFFIFVLKKKKIKKFHKELLKMFKSLKLVIYIRKIYFKIIGWYILFRDKDSH